MIRVLYANGCSFTAGTELETATDLDVPRGSRFNSTSPVRRYQTAHSWPSHLGAMLGADEVVNQARGGGSNARAVRGSLAFIADWVRGEHSGSELMVCIGLTDAARHERFVDHGPSSTGAEGGWEILKPSLTRRHHGASRASLSANRAYYGELFSDRQAAFTYVEQVLLLQLLCKRHGVRLHLHEAMEVNAARFTGPDLPASLGLVDSTTHRSFLGEGEGDVPRFLPGASFEHWALTSGVPLGPGGHPLHDGHAGWAAELATEILEGAATEEQRQ